MRRIFTALSIFCFFNGEAQEDYVIRFEDTLINVALDKSYNIDVKGSRINFIIRSKDTLMYTNSSYSFLHPKAFRVSGTKIDVGIDQVSILTAEGSGMIIQQYTSINPTSLNEMMLTEITKESINYGYELKRSAYKRKLKSGQEIEITRAVLRYKEDVNIYEVASIGKKDAGLMIVTMRMDEDGTSEGQKLIDLMWQSLLVK